MILDFSPASRPRRRLVAAATFCSAALILAGCGSSGGDSDHESGGSGSGSGDTFVAYTGQSTDYQINFNPYSPSTNGGFGTIFEALFFTTDVNDAPYEPLLGTEYSWNDDGTELSVTLREDVQWSDGEPFRADDVVFTFEMLLETPELNTGGFDGTVTAVDNHHLAFTFDEPAFVDGPSYLGETPIVPEHLWSDVDPVTDLIEEPVGTGPFLLADFKPQAFTLEANPGYWGGEPELRSIRYVALSGNNAAVDGVAGGTLDWITGVVPDVENVERNYPGYHAIVVPRNQITLTTCSNAELGCAGPQTDPAVRQAIYHALDRQQINSLAFQNTAGDVSPTFALLPQQEDMVSSSVQETVASNQPDVERATGLLESAGWAMGDDGIYVKDGARLSLAVQVVTGWTDYITALDTMTQQLAAAGIELTTVQSSWNEWTNTRTNGEFELVIESLAQGPVADPYYLYDQNYNSVHTTEVGVSAPGNIARYANPDVDDAINALRRITPDDAEARQVHIDAIQEHIVDDMPYIPVLTQGTISVYNTEDYSGWPTTEDLYAMPAVWASPDIAQIYKNLTSNN
jgi:peptide/nickel transport system substrate-binding protein